MGNKKKGIGGNSTDTKKKYDQLYNEVRGDGRSWYTVGELVKLGIGRHTLRRERQLGRLGNVTHPYSERILFYHKKHLLAWFNKKELPVVTERPPYPFEHEGMEDFMAWLTEVEGGWIPLNKLGDFSIDWGWLKRKGVIGSVMKGGIYWCHKAHIAAWLDGRGAVDVQPKIYDRHDLEKHWGYFSNEWLYHRIKMAIPEWGWELAKWGDVCVFNENEFEAIKAFWAHIDDANGED